jgi:hypothetical protein
MLKHTIELISDPAALPAVVERALAAPAFALDIETVNWWDRESEQVALVQLAFPTHGAPHVVLIDTLAGLALEPLRRPLELSLSTKAIHNASYDAVRLLRHYRISTSPIHDTMLAARRSGEKHCSLQAQAAAHLGLHLDKQEQRGDWSRRPLPEGQLHYAALDAACTLLLYEHQLARGLRGDYELRERTAQRQAVLPLGQLTFPTIAADLTAPTEAWLGESELTAVAYALLGIVTELAGRYSPEQLAVSVGSERVGLAGWLIDRVLGAAADVDEASARLAIAALCERQLIGLSPSRRLAATASGERLWRAEKNAHLV